MNRRKPRKIQPALLSPPSEFLARKILTEVSWGERIEGFFEAPMSGRQREYIFKFRDAANLLKADVSDPWSTNSGFFGYFDFGELQAWIRDVFGDKELANATGEIIAAGASLKEQIESTKLLMNHRLAQCEEVLGKSA